MAVLKELLTNDLLDVARQCHSKFQQTIPLWILYIFIVLGSIIFSSHVRQTKLKVPIVLADEIPNAKARAMEYCYRRRDLMLKGYNQFKDQVFGVNTNDGIKLVIPTKFADDLKSHPHLSFKVSIDNDMQVDYTHFGGPPEYLMDTIKGRMTPSLPLFITVLHEMVRQNIPRILGQYKDWTEVQIYDRILQLVGINNARVFLSTRASQDEDWVKYSTSYVTTVFDYTRVLKEWSPFFRPFVYKWGGQHRAIKEQWAKGRAVVAASMRDRQAKGGDHLENPPSMLDYLSSGKNEHLASDLETQVLLQMTLVAVGTVTNFASITQALYDLATYPEYIPMLREEIQAAPTDENGLFTKDAPSFMRKLDSFIKESQRRSAPDLTTYQRAATADLTLPDGTFVPKGTKLEMATSAIHMDPVHYENPDKFDGLRYYKMREKASEENRHLYVSVGKNDLSFGYGRHACPGRFLGHLNIKIILAEILRNYDLKLLPGATRPKNHEFEAIVPSPFRVLVQRCFVFSTC